LSARSRAPTLDTGPNDRSQRSRARYPAAVVGKLECRDLKVSGARRDRNRH
jgi:hypothetical protein